MSSIWNHGEEKTNSATVVLVAYRPDPSEFDRPLTKAEIAELHRKMSLLSPPHAQDAYRKAHDACRMEGDHLPPAAALQELVTAWKVLRALKRKRPPRRD